MIIALVGSYPTNKLIIRRLILEHEFQGFAFPDLIPYEVLDTVSRAYPSLKGKLSTCY
jgi:hypothetical protein